MRRREFITLLGGAAAWLSPARAQQPTMSRIGMLVGLPEDDPEAEKWIQALVEGLSQLGWKRDKNIQIDIRLEDIDLARMQRAEALLVTDDIENVGRRQLIAELASKFRLPAIYAHRVFAEAGGLIVYGADIAEILRQAARQIDKILKGGNPGEIPFYQPAKFELIINLKAAKELGLTVPPSMLSLADELIE